MQFHNLYIYSFSSARRPTGRDGTTPEYPKETTETIALNYARPVLSAPASARLLESGNAKNSPKALDPTPHLADYLRMDKYFDQQSPLPDYGKQVRVGRASNPFVNPGQNVSFSDEFLTKKRVDSCRSAEPGKTSEPMNPMKSIDYNTSEGYPAHPP